MYLLLLILVPALSHGKPDSEPSVGINLPHGSITFFGSNFGDSHGLSVPDVQSSTPRGPSYVTSYTPSFTPFTTHSSPVTFFKNQPPSLSQQSDDNNPSFFSLSYSTDPKQSKPNIEVHSPSFSPFTQGPINSAVPFSLFYPEFPSTQRSVNELKEITTESIPTGSLETHSVFNPQTSSHKTSFSFSNIGQTLEEKKKASDKYITVKEVTLQTPTRLEDIEFPDSSKQVSSSGSQKKNLKEFWNGYNEKSESKQTSVKKSSENKKAPSLNDIPIPSDNRKTRKIDFSSPSAKNITGLIKKALSLVKKVEEIDDRKRTLKSSLKNSKQSKSSSISEEKESFRSREDLEKIRELKEDKRFADLKSFIQDQSSISNLIKSETSGLRDFVEARTGSRDTGDSKTTRDMIKALARLNSISSLLLKDNDKTKTTVRQLPDEIRNIVQSEIFELKDLLEDQNIAVASALKSAIRAENRQERKSGTSDTEVVILKALAKLNKISGVLLKEQERTEQKTSSALKALPALAKFIQAETSDIKDLIEDQADTTRDADLDELKDAISQSLANDKLITRAIIKLNDITQLLLKDVNFTTSAITNKLPEALTALITSETGKIRKMIDLQNDAIVDILKESDNLARAERVIQEAQKIKQTLAGDDTGSSAERQFISESDRILEVLSPLISKNGASSLTSGGSRADKLIEILTPILNKEAETKEVEEKQSETEAVLKAQLTGQKSIVQALLKLTNITRTLLEDKDKEKLRKERPRSSGSSRTSSREQDDRDSSREKDNDRDRDDRDRDDRFPKRKFPRRHESFRYEDDYESEYYEEYYDDAPRRRPQTLVERIATSAGNRALKGNQALFEEFVKLAIERQRWEQAQDVTNIIKSTLTTEPPPEDSEEYFYSDSIEEEPRSHRPKRPKHNRVRDEYEDEIKPSTRGRPKSKPRPKPSRRPRPSRPKTTTPEPFYEYDFDDYPSEEEYEEYPSDTKEQEPIYEEEEVPKSASGRIESPGRKNIRQQLRKSSDSKGSNSPRLRPKFPPRRPFKQPDRRDQQKEALSGDKQKLETQPNREPPIKEATQKPKSSFRDSNEPKSRLAIEKSRLQSNEPSIIEVTPAKAIPVTTRPPVIKSKASEKASDIPAQGSPSLSERDKKRNELKENLLQSLLNHSKNKGKKENKLEPSREDSPRKLPTQNPKDKIQEEQASALRGAVRGRKFGRGGIPPRKQPNKVETSERLTIEKIPEKKSEQTPVTQKSPPKSFKDSVSGNFKGSTSNVQIKIPNTDVKVVQEKQPFIPTRTPTEKKTIQPKTERPKQKEEEQKVESPRQQSQRPQGRRPQFRRPEKDEEQESRTGSRRKGNPASAKSSRRPTGSRRPQFKAQKAQRPKSPPKSRTEEDEVSKQIQPLNDEERKSQKSQRNNLLKQLSKNRGDQRQSGNRPSRPTRPSGPDRAPAAEGPKAGQKGTGASALENLFNIISANKGSDNDSTKTVIKVTSSSSSSSSSSESSGPNVRIRPHGKKTGKRNGSREGGNATPTEDPTLQNLTPQERLVKKVKETLRNGDQKEPDQSRSRSNRRKKVIFRKKKTDDDQLPRSGRKLGSDGTQIKTVKVRVRRIVEPQPFPIVY